MVDGHQLVLAMGMRLLGTSLAHQDVATVPVSVGHAKIEHSYLVNLLHVEGSGAHLFTVPIALHVLLQRAALGGNLLVRAIPAALDVRKGCGRNAREVVVVQKVCSHFANGTLPDNSALSQTFAKTLANVPTGVVDGQGLLIDRLEDCNLGAIGVLQE
eukprot:1677238-Pyramimonas_sp.AAC.1